MSNNPEDQLPTITPGVQGQLDGISREIKEMATSIATLVKVFTHLALPGLTAGWQADKMQVNFEKLKTHCRSKYSSFHFV